MNLRRTALLAAALLLGGAAVSAAFAADATGAKPTPRAADGHPLLNGTWDNGSGIDFLRPEKKADGSICISGCGPAPAPRPAAAPAAGSAAATPPPAPRPGPDRPKYRPELQAKVNDLTKRQVETDPVLRCHAPGAPRIGPPDQIVQGSSETVFLYEDVSGQFFRVITTDGRPHRTDLPPTPFGDAVGHWDGDTFVVVTKGFTDDTWLTDNGAFHSGDLVVTERLRRDGDMLIWEAVADDPKVLAEPWQLRPRRATRTADGLPEEVPCIEQDLKHVIDGTHHDNPR